MMQRRNIKQLDSNSIQEDLFLTGMIVSDKFLAGINHVMEPRFFKSPHIRKISEWVLDYYEEFEKAPSSEIQEIFDIESRNEELADQELINRLLTKISAKYEGKPFNSGYVLPKMLDYIRERVVEIAIEDAQWNLKRNGPDAAWATLNQVKEVNAKIPKGVTFYKEFDDRFDDWFYQDKTEIMRFPGALGAYFAPLLRKKLIAFMGKPKSGKSWWLLYCAMVATMFRLNVAFFSLEMETGEVEERLACMLTGREFGSGSKSYTTPVFDCRKNQDDTCTKSIRTNAEESILDDGEIPDYANTPHEICDVCRLDWDHGDTQATESDFEYSTWMQEEDFQKLSPKEIAKAVDQFRLHFGKDTLKIFSHRIGTVSVDDLESELDHVELMEGWIPDVVIVDYADIAKKKASVQERRHQLSDIWEQLSGMVKERNALGFTASQGNRGSVQKTELGSEDIAEDFGKVMIVDGLIGINEDNTEREKIRKDKYWQRQNLKWIAHRYKKDLREWERVVVLHSLTLGQVHVDSEIT